MTDNQTTKTTDPEPRLITCVLYRGGGDGVLKALHQRGLNSATLAKGRGSAIGDPADFRGQATEFEKEILSVMVDAEKTDEVMDFIFETAQIDRPYGGFVYVEKLRRGVPLVLPDLPEEQ
ncbi:MAG: hypothetical protein MUF22_06995 [Chitinispirillaceae bacterium]|jgi:nitrogen regulatory protein PII|nr:hypothetical protein [Chitinispirillaceae bacterium]